MFEKIKIFLLNIWNLDFASQTIISSLILTFISLKFNYELLIITAFVQIIYLLTRFKGNKLIEKFFSITIIIFCTLSLSLSVTDTSANLYSLKEKQSQVALQIISDPDCSNNYCQFVVKSANFSQYALLKLRDSEQAQNIENGDSVEVKTIFQIPQNYSDFDYKNYLENKNIYLISKNAELISISKTQEIYQSFRNYLYKIFNLQDVNFSQVEESLLKGIVFGFRNDLQEDLKLNFQDTGLTHIIAVSGFNVTLLIGFSLIFAKYINRRNTYLLSIILVTVYMSLVGFNNLPAFRAYVMGGFIIISYLIGRKISKLNVILISFLIIQLIDPKSILQVSFQLSFLTYLGIIYLQESVENKLIFLPNLVRSNFTSSLVATFLSFPIISQISNQVSIIAPFANIFVLPLIPIIMILGIIYYLLKLCNLAFILVFPLKILLNLTIEITKLFANFDFATIALNARIQSILNITWLILLLLIIFYLNYKKHETTTSQNSKDSI